MRVGRTKKGRKLVGRYVAAGGNSVRSVAAVPDALALLVCAKKRTPLKNVCGKSVKASGQPCVTSCVVAALRKLRYAVKDSDKEMYALVESALAMAARMRKIKCSHFSEKKDEKVLPQGDCLSALALSDANGQHEHVFACQEKAVRNQILGVSDLDIPCACFAVPPTLSNIGMEAPPSEIMKVVATAGAFSAVEKSKKKTKISKEEKEHKKEEDERKAALALKRRLGIIDKSDPLWKKLHPEEADE